MIKNGTYEEGILSLTPTYYRLFNFRYNFIQNGNEFFQKLTLNILKSERCDSEETVHAINDCYDTLPSEYLQFIHKISPLLQNMFLSM